MLTAYEIQQSHMEKRAGRPADALAYNNDVDHKLKFN